MNNNIIRNLGVFLLFVFLFSSLSRADVFINEIHYDNLGTDTEEGIEIAGPAGTDLSGWTIELYNGNGGTRYATVTLTGTIDDEGSGYGALWFAKSGIQNGAPDGLALIDNAGNVIQFLSYEGSFTATDGPANGMTSSDIGVSEPGSPVGESLQLTGTGTVYADFSWSGPVAGSKGDINSEQIFQMVSDSPPVISNVQRNTLVPAADANITVTADVTDDNGLTLVQLRYMINNGAVVTVAMTNMGGDRYSADIPASAYDNGNRVAYWIHAEDDASPAQIMESPQNRFVAGMITIDSLHQVDSNGRSTYLRYYAKINGTATVNNGTFSGSSLDVYLQDASGGINLYKQGADSIIVALGNNYTVVGKIDQYNGKLEIIPDNAGTDITDNGAGTIPEPVVKTIAELLATPETFEGMLIKIVNVNVTDGSWPAEGRSVNLSISDDGGVNTLTMRIDNDTDIDGSSEGAYPLTLTGIMGQYDGSSPYTSGYQILPRSTADLEWTSAVVTGLIINEIMASNDAAFADEHGEYDDWIEIYNSNNYAVDLGGLYLTDDLSEPTQWQIPVTAADTTTIPAGGFLVLWADKQSEQGVLHLELKLSGSGEQVGLAQIVDGDTTYIDSLSFGPQWADTSYGYVSDGSGDRAYFNPSTPGESNANGIVVVGIKDTPNPAITDFHLAQNFPNPFNPTTAIRYRLTAISDVQLTVYNALGQKVQTLINERQEAGNHVLNFDAAGLSSGIYYYKLQTADGYTQIKRMTLIK